MDIKTKKYTYKLIENLGLLVNSEIEKELNFLKPKKISSNEEKQLVSHLRREISDEDIDGIISNVSNLVLTLTEDCNLRCLYCAYSGIYDGERTHSKRKMKLETAIKAIDLFYKYIGLEKRKLKINLLPIGFYGGEPLLEIELIRNIIEYAKKRISYLKLDKTFKIYFAITTNGTLLNEDNTDFLVKNGFHVSVSIDGPQLTHDKFRVTASKKGSWQLVIDNLYRFKSRYPKFYKENVSFLCTVHPLHDGEAIDRFFLSNQNLFNLERIRYSNLKKNSLKETEKQRILKDGEKFTRSRLQFEKYISTSFDSDKFKINIIEPHVKLTGTCFPGSKKFFIGVDGKIHICESISPNFPIGNVSAGINYDNIRRIIREFNEGIIERECWKCEIWFLCNTCFTISTYGDDIRLYCPKKDIIDGLTNFLSFKEQEYENIQKDCDFVDVSSYLDFL